MLKRIMAVLLAAWPTGSVAQADLPGGLTGLDQLSPEDQQAVKQYGNFLEAQKQEQLQKFIDFLLGKHQ